MGTIEERKSDTGGETNYRAKVRLKGTTVQSATFQRKIDAKNGFIKLKLKFVKFDTSKNLNPRRILFQMS